MNSGSIAPEQLVGLLVVAAPPFRRNEIARLCASADATGPTRARYYRPSHHARCGCNIVASGPPLVSALRAPRPLARPWEGRALMYARVKRLKCGRERAPVTRRLALRRISRSMDRVQRLYDSVRIPRLKKDERCVPRRFRAGAVRVRGSNALASNLASRCRGRARPASHPSAERLSN